MLVTHDDDEGGGEGGVGDGDGGGGCGVQQRDLGSKPCQEPGIFNISQMEGWYPTPGPLNSHPYNALTILVIVEGHKKDIDPRHKTNSTERDLCCQASGLSA
jgi:hypothetical protein